MSAAQWHLLLNHVPVLFTVVALSLLVAGLARKSRELRLTALILIVVTALGTIPGFLTGQDAESQLKNYPGVSRFLIERHEEAAKPALIAIEVAGGASLLLLIASWLGKSARDRWFFLVLALTGVAFGLVARAAHLGGVIRHEEIRSAEELSGTT